MKKFFLILMVTVMLTTTSFAAFSDLPEGHWAKGVVEEMVEAGIISGYTDGTFRPSKEISKIESLILLSRVAGLNKYPNEANSYLEKYTSTLSKYSTQYKKDVAYLLGTNVLKESDLDNLLLADKINSPLSREEMAVLVTKVLGKENEATKNSIVVLPFSDTSSISASAKPYVYYVYSEKIMAGMDSETFSPKTALTRAQAASIFQRIYKKITIVPSISSKPNTPVATTFVTGTITKIDTSTSSVFIKANGSTEEYEFDNNTKFYVNSKEVTSSALKVNATVTATITDDLYITSMNITEGAKITTKTVKGTIYSASSASKTITITSDGSRIAYNYDSSTTYTLDGKTSSLTAAIKKDYEVTLTVDSTNLIVKAAVVSPYEKIIGKIIDSSTSYGYIVIEDEDGDEYILMDEYIDEYDEDYDGEKEDYYFDNKTEYKYNNSSKTYKNIATSSYLYKKGNYAQITLDDDDYITSFEVATKKSYFTDDDEDNDKDDDDKKNDEEIIGKIIKVSSRKGYIVIEDSTDDEEYIIMDDYIGEYDADYDDEDEDYYFDKSTKFYYEGSSKTYDKLATSSYIYSEGKFVRIVLDDDYIVEMEVASKKANLEGGSTSNDDDEEEYLTSEDMLEDNYLIGEVVDLSDDEITIETDDGEEYTIDVLSDAIFLDYDSDDPSYDCVEYVDAYDDEDIYEGDRVLIILCDDDETALIILID